MSSLAQSVAPVRPGAAEFRPIFVVGCQRSGTTALAVMLDRHPDISMLSETHFFCRFVDLDRKRGGAMSHEAMLARARDDFFINQTQPDYDVFRETFLRYPPTYPHLFKALLQAHSLKHGKPRPAEKSCDHLFQTREILALYPGARVICIVRDGRDVVRSINKLGWDKGHGPVGACRQWNAFVREGRRLARELSPDVFTTVRFEDLMIQPETELRRLCEFLGVEFLANQIEGGADTAAVPQAELEWKGKAREAPDPSRVAAWRKCGDPTLIAEMNYYMGDGLRMHAYPDAEVRGVSLSRRLGWGIRYFPYRRGIYPLASASLRAVRSITGKEQSE